jgi:F420-non-reducing hydrogenase small subunit
VYTATGCRACEQGVLDLDHEVAALGRFAEPVFWPYVLGTSWDALPAEVDVALLAGAILTDADREAAKRLRARSRVVVAVGACAAFGGLPGLANLSGPEAPVRSLAQVVPVDYTVPGCPPPQSLLWAAVLALVGRGESAARLSYAAARLPEPVAAAIAAGVLPPRGSVFAGEKAVCASCSRVKEEKRFTAGKRPSDAYEETGRCLLEQGLLCQGVATQEGCGGLCTGAGVPCRGCFGKAPAVYDPGAKMVAAIGSTFDSAKADEIARLADGFLDLAGTLYRYALPAQCALLAAPPAADEGCDGCR